MPIETKTRKCGTSACDGDDTRGSALAIYQKGEDCTRRLRRHRSINSPSLPVQLTENRTELRDGSQEFPIALPAMQKHLGESLPSLIGMLPDGTLVRWDFGYFLGKKKFSLIEGQISMVGDYGSDLFDQDICDASCGAIDGAVGFKAIVETCPGRPDKTVYQLVRIPVCCCDGNNFGEDCPECSTIDDIIVPNTSTTYGPIPPDPPLVDGGASDPGGGLGGVGGGSSNDGFDLI